MADTEKRLLEDILESANLERSLADVERYVQSLPPDKRPFFTEFKAATTARLEFLERRIREAEAEKESEWAKQIAVVAQRDAALKEAALNEEEKDAYRGFLKKEFFTKNDFKELEQFYTKSWDRLSEAGKAEMDHRVWEGIRRGEYKFNELPSAVRERTAERAYRQLDHPSPAMGGAEVIPESERKAFIRAYEAGRYEEANRILDKEAFKWNMSRDRTPEAVRQADATTGQDAEAKRIADTSSARKPDDNTRQQISAKANNDIRDLDLSGLRMADAPAQVSAATIPTADAAAGKAGPTLGA